MSSEAAESPTADLIETLSLQLSEVEMLSSMFPDRSEFVLDDQGSVAEINAFLEGQIDASNLQSRIGFTVKLSVGGQPLELVCRLPYDYPSVLPQIFFRAASLSRTQHHLLSEAMWTHLSSCWQSGELLTCALIDWLQDNAESYFVNEAPPESSQPKGGRSVDPKSNMFCRMWIYSHHIYSKIKRKDMLEFGSELNLTGFYVPGKPGIIVLEGYLYDVEDFWGRIRRMQWKKLTMKEREDIDMGDKTVEDFRKFGPFEERYFAMRQAAGRAPHADRGQLFQYLEERGFGHMFNIYFHVEGKLAEDD